MVKSGREVQAPTYKKARILVARLALTPLHPFTRDDLAAHLWPDVEREKARFNLRQLLAVIRRTSPELNEHIVADDRISIRFEPNAALVDALEFKRLASLDPEGALEFYRGPLLASIDDPWLRAPRAELERTYLALLEALAESSDARSAVKWLRRAAETDVYGERLHGKLLAALVQCGDLTGATIAFRRFSDLLYRDLNLTPSPETSKLYRHLLNSPRAAHPLPTVASHRNRLPVPLSSILGREGEIASIRELLDKGRLVTLVGPGGVGKTRLAISVGEAEQAARADGVWFADFSSVRDGQRVPQTLGHALGFLELPGVGWEDVIRDGIGGSDCLLILDNCEHLADACASLCAELLSCCPEVRILATGRLPLAVAGEQRFAVQPLELPLDDESLPDSDYTRFAGLRLFQERARLVAPTFTVTTDNVERVIAVCKEVDGLPLGIEMASARLGALSLDNVSKRLNDKLLFLVSPNRTVPPRHRSLGAVIDWSYELLSDEAKIVFERLSTFGGSWSLEAAEGVCGFDPLSPDRVLKAVVSLVEASIVQCESGRYSFLETVRQYAGDRFGESQTQAEVKERHLAYYVERFSRVEDTIAEMGPDRAALEFGDDMDNVRNALEWSLSGGSIEAGLWLVSTAPLAFAVLQLDGEAADWLRRILAFSEKEGSQPGRIAALRRATRFYKSNHANIDRAEATANTIRACKELCELAEFAGDTQALADGICVLGEVGLHLDQRTSKEHIARALTLNESLPGGGWSDRPLCLLGHCEEYEGRFPEASQYYARAAAQAKNRDDTGALIYIYQCQAHLHRDHCQYDEALEKLNEVERLARSWGDKRLAAFSNLAFAEFRLDRWEFDAMQEPLDRARVFYQESRSRFHEMLVDGLSRYRDAHDGLIHRSVTGLSSVAAKLINGAQGSPWGWWHGAGIEFEALAMALGQSAESENGAMCFGMAQALRERDGAFLSPSVKARWENLGSATGFGAYSDQIAHGRTLDPERCLREAEDWERMLVGRQS